MRIRLAYFQGLAAGLTSDKDNHILSKMTRQSTFSFTWITSCCHPTKFTKMEDEFSYFEELICSFSFLVASNNHNNATIGFAMHENL